MVDPSNKGTTRIQQGEQLTFLLNAVYRYYPIGMVNFTDWPGFKKMREIVDFKFLHECNNQDSLPNKFHSSLQSRIPFFMVENMSSHDFPNYMYYCPLYEIDYKTIYHKLSVVACVSLLCEFYTLFFEDEVLVRNAAEPNEFISRFSIWSFEKSKARDNKQIVPIFVDEFEKYFPNKKYISHEFLANRKLEASVPYAEEVSLNPNENIYSLYELLFHYPGWRQKIDILE